VRVQFHWDREGRRDDQSSCWIRVSQGWGSAGYGFINLPRVGQDVIVDFGDGDPDHPFVVGRLHNATSPVPYRLPDHAVSSGWRSATSPGGGGSNEIKLGDGAGSEGFYMHAQRDLHRLVQHDEAAQTGGAHRLTVGRDQDLCTGQTKEERLTSASHLTVAEGLSIQADAGIQRSCAEENVMVLQAYAMFAEDALHVLSKEIVIHTDEKITVLGPGGFITIHTAGVDIVGKLVRINSGGAPL